MKTVKWNDPNYNNDVNRETCLTKKEHEDLEHIINFFLYEDGFEHDKKYIEKIEDIKCKLKMRKGSN